MKDNRGFTLVEILAVIVILGIIITLSMNTYFKSSNDTKTKIYEKKVELIEKAAIMCAEDYSIGECNKVVSLGEKGYLVYDKKNKDGVSIVEDPRGKYESLNNCKIEIIESNGIYKASLNDDNCKTTE